MPAYQHSRLLLPGASQCSQATLLEHNKTVTPQTHKDQSSRELAILKYIHQVVLKHNIITDLPQFVFSQNIHENLSVYNFMNFFHSSIVKFNKRSKKR
jgi:hypothetical protein